MERLYPSIKENEINTFLRDFEDNSETMLLTEASKQNEIIAIAKNKGILLKDSFDLAGFKCVYAFTDKPNNNKDLLPKKELLRVLPTLIGKPVNLEHIRRNVVGMFIDYRFIEKENKVIAYGIFFKDVFSGEWEQFKKLLKQKKLSTSYEVWNDESKEEKLSDGTKILHDLQIAGMAILFREKPAFDECKVLAIAKKNLENSESRKLVYACLNKDGLCKLENKKGLKLITASEELPIAQSVSNDLKIVCSNCGENFEHNFVVDSMNQIKCPNCYAILDKTGAMIHPPQIRDFDLSCSKCGARNNWLILAKNENEAKVKCLACIAEGSKILMSDFSTKNIEDVGVEDKILTFTEKPPFVLKEAIILNKIYKGKLKTIDLSANGYQISLTPDHRICAIKSGSTFYWKEAEEARGLRIKTIDYISDTGSYLKGVLIGFIESDGYTVKSGKETFSFAIAQKSEKENLEFLLNYFKLDYSKTSKKSGFTGKFGGYTYRIKVKHTNFIISIYDGLNSNKEIQKGFISGFILGDGSWNKRNWVVTQKNGKPNDLFIRVLNLLLLPYAKSKIKKGKLNNYSFKKLSIPFYAPNSIKFNKFKEAILNGKTTMASLKKDVLKIDDKKERKKVWDLTTTEGTFIANGFLVHNCASEYGIEFKNTGFSIKHIKELKMLKSVRLNCPQCGETITKTISSAQKKIDMKCQKCGMEFPFDTTFKRMKKIQKVNSINKEVKKEEDKVEEELYSLKVAQIELSKEEVDTVESLQEIVEGKKLELEERKKIPDSMFAVIIKKKGKSGKILKIRKYPLDTKDRVRSALRYLGMPRNQATLRKLGVSVKSVLRKILKRAKELGMTELLKRRAKAMDRKLLRKAVSKIRDTKKQAKLATSKLEKFTGGIKKFAGKIRGLRKEAKDYELKIASLNENLEETKKITIANASKSLKRREELGDFAKNLTDKDLIDEAKYELAKAKKIIAEKEVEEKKGKKPELKTASLNVGDKEQEEEWAKGRKKVNKSAFSK